MSVLKTATNQQVKRLLDSFPVTTLKNAWPSVRGSKEEICFAAAEERNVSRIAYFMEQNIGQCRTHVYVFTEPTSKEDPVTAVPGAEVIASSDGGSILMLTRAVFSVYLRDPAEEASVEFLWPLRMQSKNGLLIVSFVVLERNPCIYYEERDCYQIARSLDERGIVSNLEQLGYVRTDLHAGIKKLWADNLIDSFRTKYRKPTSTATEHMDEELGIKQHNPELYEVLQTATLFGTSFQVDSNWKCGVEVFVADPTVGYLAFPRYAEGSGDADAVVERILQANQ